MVTGHAPGGVGPDGAAGPTPETLPTVIRCARFGVPRSADLLEALRQMTGVGVERAASVLAPLRRLADGRG
jgi:hypothetical protein